MKLLVTGGAGYIGSVVTRMLLDAGHQVVVLDDLPTGHPRRRRRTPPSSRRRIHDAASVLTADAGFDGGAALRRPDRGRRVDGQARSCTGTTTPSARCALLDAMRAAGVPPDGLLLHRRRLRRTRPSCPITETAVNGAHQHVRRHQARRRHGAHLRGDRARAGRRVAALLQRGRRLPRRRRHARRAARPGDAPDPDRAAGRRRPAGEAPALRRRLPHPRRHLRPRLHPRRRPGPGPPAGAGRGHRPGEHRIYNLGNGNGFSNRQVVEVVREVTGHPTARRGRAAPRRRPGRAGRLVRAARDELGWVPAEADLHDMVADAWAFYRTHILGQS